MSLTEQFESDDINPIDIAETLAEAHDWAFDRIDDGQIALAVEGAWRTYALTLAWSPVDDTLRLVLTFEAEVEEARHAALHELLNRINDRLWTGAFSWWGGEGLMVWRYALHCAGTDGPVPQQIDAMVSAGVDAAERFYPAFQLALWGDTEPEAAMTTVMAEAYGRA